MDTLIRCVARRAARRWKAKIPFEFDATAAEQFVVAQIRSMPLHFRTPILIATAAAVFSRCFELPAITRFYDSMFLLAWLEGFDRDA